MASKSRAAKATVGALGAILAAVFAVEGGYVNDPNDPGGETNHGITIAVARSCGYTGPMRSLPKATAEACYRKRYVESPGYTAILNADPAVAYELIDTGINAGPHRSSLWLQESLNSLNNRARDWGDIAEDGQVGRGTLFAYSQLQRRRGPRAACEVLLKMLDAKQATHYMRLGSGNSKFETFVFGWFKRVGPPDPVKNIPGCDAAERLAL